MKFAQTVAALVIALLTLTPLSLGLRAAFLEQSILVGDAYYAASLAALYLALLALLSGSRWIAVTADAWRGSGLELLDYGTGQKWPSVVATGLGVLATIAVAWTSKSEVVATVAECIVASVAIALAVRKGELRPLDEEENDPLPAPIVPPPVEPTPPGPEDQTKTLELAWYFHRDPGTMGNSAEQFVVSLPVSTARYQELRQRDHSVRAEQDYVRFVREGLTPEIIDLSVKLREVSSRAKLGQLAEINNILAFAQRFRYVLDSEAHGQPEYPKFPLETLVDDAGDCEDHAILAAACLRTLGYDTRLVFVNYNAGGAHMALAVASSEEEPPDGFFLACPKSGRRYFYCEATTDAGARNPNAVSFRMGQATHKDNNDRLTLLDIA